jgi:acetylornithine deacetylase/succinyl-diaminopimelate desuccinylase-like protein
MMSAGHAENAFPQNAQAIINCRMLPDDVRAHGKDERIGVKEFYDGVDFMYLFIKALSSEKNP